LVELVNSQEVKMAGRALGAYIRERRIELGLSQEQLAERIGATKVQSDISRLERGRVSLPRPSVLMALAAALEVPVGNLLIASGWFDECRIVEPVVGQRIPQQPVVLETLSTLEKELLAIQDLERQSQARSRELMAAIRQLRVGLTPEFAQIAAD
jgi:transcriptional regulator with XRE-family HTH domain